METVKKLHEQVIFPWGAKIAGAGIANDHFTGTAWLQMLVPDDNSFHCPVGNVTFEPGARNNWHRHPGGQILLVTSGKGYSQEEDRPVQVIRKGDVLRVLPGVKHWHGATPDSWMSHLAVMPNSDRGDAAWLEPVTDEEYQAIPYS